MPDTRRLPPELRGWFVDRDVEIGHFLAMLDSGGPCILLLTGNSGMGKSWLMDVLYHECSLREIPQSEIRFGGKPYDFMAVCRKIRDDLGAMKFGPFTDLLNWCTTPDYKLVLKWRAAEFLKQDWNQWFEALTVEQDDTRHSVRDNLKVFLHPQLARYRVSNKLTAQLIRDASSLIASEQHSLVCFFDHVDMDETGAGTDPETQQWLWMDFIPSLARQAISGTGKRLIAVVAARKAQTLESTCENVTRRVEIKNLQREHVTEYATYHGISNPWSSNALWVLSQEGCPHLLGQALDYVNTIEGLVASDSIATKCIGLQRQLDIRRKNLADRELVAAQHGLVIPLEVINETIYLKDEIARLEREIARLKQELSVPGHKQEKSA